MIIKLRTPYSGETMKNYIVYDFETGNAEIVLLNRELLPRCFKIIVQRICKQSKKETV